MHAIIIDPPYGLTRGSPNSPGYDRPWDVAWDDGQWAELQSQLRRVLAPGGHILIFSQGTFTRRNYRRIELDTPMDVSREGE